MMKQKRALDSQIVRAKENFKLSYGEPSLRQPSDLNQRIKALRQGRHWVSVLTHRRAIRREFLHNFATVDVALSDCMQDVEIIFCIGQMLAEYASLSGIWRKTWKL